MNRDTLLRQLDMLLAIPRWPRKRSTAEIARYLRDHRGHRIHVRTVQRDLLRLETDFGYLCEEDGRAQLWYYPADNKDPVTYTLHRVKAAKRLEDSAARPDGFKLADWARKTMRFPVSDATLRLVARFDPATTRYGEFGEIGDPVV